MRKFKGKLLAVSTIVIYCGYENRNKMAICRRLRHWFEVNAIHKDNIHICVFPNACV